MRHFKTSLFVLFFSYMTVISNANSEEVGALNGKAGVSSSGAATYSIPIEVPPALSGLQPSISLQYNSQARQVHTPVKLSDIRSDAGSMGIGWRIAGLSAISRCQTDLTRDEGIDGVDYDDNDQFCLDGERLILVSGTHGEQNSEYRTQMNGFNKIVAQGSAGNGPQSFKVWRNDGRVAEYGSTDNSRQEALERSEINSWNISAIKDSSGNQVDFVYEKNIQNLIYRISKINYEEKSIEFNYDDSTSTTGELLSLIGIKRNNILQNSYKFSFESNYRKNLKSIQKCSLGNCQNPTVFKWSGLEDFESFKPYELGVDKYGYDHGWRFANNVRVMADVNGDGFEDIVGFAHEGARVSLSNGNGTFRSYTLGIAFFGYHHGWRTDQHIRTMSDVNGDGLQDIVGFAHDGPRVSLSNGDGTFKPYFLGINKYGSGHGWTFAYNVRVMSDVDGDGLQDIVGFAHEGARVSLSNGDGTFRSYILGIADFGYHHGWRTEKHIRTMSDVNGDGFEDIVGFADDGVRVSLSNGNGTFKPYSLEVAEFGYNQGWRIDKHIRTMSDVNGDGFQDIVGFGDDGVRVSLSNGNGTFKPYVLGVELFGYNQGWRTENNVRTMSDVNGDGLQDIVGFGDDGVRVSLSNGNGTFKPYVLGIAEFGVQQDWSTGMHIRTMSDVNGDGLQDIVGFGDDGVRVSISNSEVSLLAEVVNPFGRKTVFINQPLTNNDIYSKADSHVNYPVNKGEEGGYPAPYHQSPIYVVSKIQTDNGQDGTNSTSYKYHGMKIHKRGLGSLGFSKITKTDDFSKISSITEYLQDYENWKVGVPSFQTVTTESGIVISKTTYDWEVNPIAAVGTANGHNERFTKYLGRIISSSYKLNGDEVSKSITINCDIDATYYSNSDSCTKNNYDAHGNSLYSQTIITDIQNGSVKYNTETTNTYWAANNFASSDNWFVSQPNTTSVKKYGDNLVPITRSSKFNTYDSAGHLTKLIVEPGSSQLVNEYEYNGSYERISKSTVSGDDFTSRVTDYTYDEANPYLATTKQVVNGIIHSSTTESDPQTGNPITVTDINAIPTNFSYDGFGRLKTQTSADGSSLLVEYKWCVADCPEGAVYYEQSTHADAFTSSVSKVFFDKLQRVISTQEQGFNGDAIHVDYSYDTRGRQVSTTEPYKTGDIVYKTQTTSFDLLDRPTDFLLPTNDTISITYNGLETTKVNAKQQSSRTLKNALGQVLVSTNDDQVDQTFTYDAWGNLRTSTDAATTANVVEMIYDLKGNKTSIIDKDKGTLDYKYNGLGELITQTDAKQNTTCMAYDTLGRLTKRIDKYTGTLAQAKEEPGVKTGCTNNDSNPLTARWIYDTADGEGIGQLHESSDALGYKVVYGYDSLGRPSTEVITIAGVQYNLSTSYYANTSLIDVMSYPKVGSETFAVKNRYNVYGYLVNTEDTVTGTKYFTAIQMNARGQLTDYSLGNGVTTNQTYYPETGYPEFIDSKKGSTTLQYLSYGFDALGNLEYRQEPLNGYSESLTYDDLNRLTNTSVFGTQWSANKVVYDSAGLGNISFNSGAGTYGYGEPNDNCPMKFAGPHAVTSVSGGFMQGAMNYCYDQNGNIEFAKNTTGIEYEIQYTTFDKPNYLKRGSNEVAFKYGPNRQRIQRTDNNTKTTTYVGGVYEKIESGSSIEHKFYVGDFAIVSRSSTLSPAQYSTNYIHRDHLGSVDVISDQNGVEVENQSFDAWGKRRRSSWESDLDLFTFNSDYTSRGYTDHEHIDSIGLIHMNGRVYDPVIARFLSADPYINSQYNNQEYNRYSYVLNNPLSMTDPSGFTSYCIDCPDTTPGYSSINLSYYTPSYVPSSQWQGLNNTINASAQATRDSINASIAAMSQSYANLSANISGNVNASTNASINANQARIAALHASLGSMEFGVSIQPASNPFQSASMNDGVQVAAVPLLLLAPELAVMAFEASAIVTSYFAFKVIDEKVNGDTDAMSTMGAAAGGMPPEDDGEENNGLAKPKYTISSRALKDANKKGLGRAFQKATDKGWVTRKEGVAGIKRLQGRPNGFTHEIKITGSGARIAGKINSQGVIEFTKFLKNGFH